MGARSASRRAAGATRFCTLLYHHVGPPGRALPSLSLSPATFEAQMRWLVEHGYAGLACDEVVAFYRSGKALPRKPVLITFDDAYADIAQYALPVVRGHGLRALVLVVTALTGGTNAWDAAPGKPVTPLMGADQIAAWSQQGIEFGSHTRTHCDLGSESMRGVENEIDVSAQELARLTGTKCIAFSYPWGRYSSAALTRVRGSYSLAFTTVEGINRRDTDPHLLRRTMVQPNDSLAGFGWRVRLGRNPLLEARGILARARNRVLGRS